MNVTMPLPQEVFIEDATGKQFSHKVFYEWKPSFCEKCKKVGHDCSKTKVPQKPKGKVTQAKKGSIRPSL